jgi:threonine dehydrogenase-like Zn-dependent dehydrogenase
VDTAVVRTTAVGRRHAEHQQPAEARVSLSPFRIYNDEITVVGSMAVLHSFGTALDLVASGQVDVEPLISHSFGLDDFPTALTLVRDGKTTKAQIDPSIGATR